MSDARRSASAPVADDPAVPAGGGAEEPGPWLRLVATPLGNMEDITLRALRSLAECDLVACEDTRVTRKLFTRHRLPPPRAFLAHHAHNEEASAAGLLARLAAGERICYCSDAGTPGVSDPGTRLAAAAREAGFPVTVLPGPSAALTALLASGLPTASFTFLGFPPRKPGKLARFLAAEKKRRHTLILYESPRRLDALLAAALQELGDRPAAVCLELTKKHERVRRGTLAELARRYADLGGGNAEPGEATVVIGGAVRGAEASEVLEAGAADG